LAPELFSDFQARTTVGSGPVKIDGPALSENGKPVVFWYGAEYSPFAAVERWPLIIALSRFGTWSSLSTVMSSSTDTPANIASFTFYGARYSSPYLAFQSVEQSTNERDGSFYVPLQHLTPEQGTIVKRYDVPNGSIPFIDFGNQVAMTGSSYDSALLEGRSVDEIAAAISDPATDISQSVIGSANALTAEICRLTYNQPASVCVQVGTHTAIRG
jgi:hypothetical protein